MMSIHACFFFQAEDGIRDTGKAMRAIAEDAPIAAAFGVDVRRLSLLLSGLSAAFAGVAGLSLALSYTLAPGQIYAWLGVAFAAVMLGGLGNPLGPLVAGIVIGVSEALTMAFTAPAWAPLVSFSLLLVLLLARPGRIQPCTGARWPDWPRPASRSRRGP